MAPHRSLCQGFKNLMTGSLASAIQSSAGVPLLRVPAGSFTIGSPESENGHRPWELEREVAFACDFYLGQFPVTQAQYHALIGTSPPPHGLLAETPVTAVTWEMARHYCTRLTQLDRQAGLLPVDWEYRLPTEAEWEYACRAGSSAPRHGEPQEVAWFQGNAEGRPHPVGQKRPNAWGFHDLLGNVWEWCQDAFWEYNQAYGQSYRSLRGGSYFSSSRYCRAAQRWGLHANTRSPQIGFRLLAAPLSTDSFNKSPPIDNFPKEYAIYNAIRANDFAAALRIVTADPDAVECPEGIPPPLEYCGDEDKPEWIEWLLDHGADIERLNHDYGATALRCAVIRRQKRIIQTLVKRGADASAAMKCAQLGLSGRYEDDPSLDRRGYSEIVELLRSLGIE